MRNDVPSPGYGLFIVVGLAIVASQIATVRSSTGETPFLSANDRSRWAAMSALVDYGTARTDTPQAYRDPVTKRATLQSIDRVMHRGDDGRLHSYSSKPPLLVAGYAAFYFLAKLITGATVYTHPLLVGRWTVAFAHLLPLALYWHVLARLFQQWTPCAKTRLFMILAAIFGTHVLSFSVTVNNHLPGAMAALLTLVGLLHCLQSSASDWRIYAGTGIAAGMGVVCELPALSFAAVVGCILLLKSPRLAIAAYGGAISLVALAFFATNWWAHGSVRPPYMHRNLGPALSSIPPAAEPSLAVSLPELLVASNAKLTEGPNRQALNDWIKQHGPSQTVATIVPSGRSPHWEIRFRDEKTQEITERIALVPQPDRGDWALHVWDDWYDYPGSYWTARKPTGVDRGEPNRWTYAFHTLVGHHGIFSLTPIWLTILLSIGAWNVASEGRWAAWGIMAVTVICLAFYWMRPEHDRNYGGVSCCFRWLVWQIPLWLWLAIPGVEKLLRSRTGTLLAYLLLAASVFSAFSAIDNPWQHPWIYRYGEYLGWLAG